MYVGGFFEKNIGVRQKMKSNIFIFFSKNYYETRKIQHI